MASERPKRHERARERLRLAMQLAGAAMLAGAVGVFAWVGLRGRPPLPVPAPVQRADFAAPAPQWTVTVADGPAILRHRAPALAMFRMAENPAVLVLDFASLHEQGRMLDRAAAMVEKAGLPHDRVLDDPALAQAIQDKHLDPDTFYYGHDYGAPALAAFFAAADRDHVALTPEEEDLRALLRQERPLALISIPQPDPAHGVDASMRDAIFLHERAHGEYFSNPAYAAFARRFWADAMTAGERAGFRAYLAREDYDPAIEDLIINETQAYLVHTRDPRFFDPAAAGLTAASLERLRGLFLQAMPPGWLRDRVSLSGLTPRRRQRATVSSRITPADRRTPRARACSMAARRSRA